MGIDPAPGPVVVGGIANILATNDGAVTAAVLAFDHPTGNSAFVWLFRVAGASANDLTRR